MVWLDQSKLKQIVYGGAVLGAGGGGSIDAGLSAGRKALAEGKLRLVDLAELPDDATLVTFSGVGTVGKMGGVGQLDGHHEKALRLFLQMDKRPISGFIPSEVGAQAVTYGWHESILSGVPIVDAPCNGRAHPLSIMGSLGLHRFPAQSTTTVAIGGKPRTDKYLELCIRANVVRASQIVRKAVAQSGVSLAVVRNPLPASYIGRHAALGGLKYALRVGETLLGHVGEGLTSVLRALSRLMGGTVLGQGSVESVDLTERVGFTVGTILLLTESRGYLRIPVCNEHMMVLDNESSLAAFPDLISLFDSGTSLPLSSSDVRPGQQVAVFGVPRSQLKLGSTMSDRALLHPIEKLLGIRIPAEGIRISKAASTGVG